MQKAKRSKLQKVADFQEFLLLKKKQNGAKKSKSGDYFGGFFERVKKNHQLSFNSLICCILHNVFLDLFP